MRRRRVEYANLTSLLDVLFIVVFASLIHGASLEARARAEDPPPPRAAPPAGPVTPNVDPAVAEMRRAAIDLVVTGLEDRKAVVARISTDGRLSTLEQTAPDGVATKSALGLPLVERVPDPDIALAYLGEGSAELRVCSLVRLHLGVADLSRHLVIIAPEAPLSELSVALARGLQRDADRCLADQRGVAVILDPRATSAPPEAP